MRGRWLMALAALDACTAATDDARNPSYDPPRGPLFEQFADVTASSGVHFEFATPDFKGGGLAVADLDGDGRPDIIATRRVSGLTVFHNLGELRFEEDPSTGIDPTLAITAIAAADLDNDGDIDLVLAGGNVAYIMANQGHGTFVQVGRFDQSGMTEHVLAADLDGDGLLDLYFSNYDTTDLSINSVNRLFMNRGQLQFSPGIMLGGGCTWTTTAFDFDGDGDQDLYVANDTLLADFGYAVASNPTTSTLPPDLLLRNDGPGSDGALRFTDVAAEMGMATPRSSMGGLLGDFDGDGRLDLYIPNEGTKVLYLRDASGGFVESAAALGVLGTARANQTCTPDTQDPDCLLLSWGAALSDFDLDGHDELIVDNGETVLNEPPPMLMFARGAEPTFHEVSPNLAQLDGRGMVVTDLDGDGDQDLVITQRAGPLVIYENMMRPAAGTWLRVTLRGHASNRQGVGAVVTIHTVGGGSQMREVAAGGMINTASPAEAFFGLGSDVTTSVEVLWPSGKRSSVTQAVSGELVMEEPP